MANPLQADQSLDPGFLMLMQLVMNSPKSPEESCRFCNTREATDKKMKHCSNCKIQSYCGQECQKADWSKHKITCQENVDHALLYQLRDASLLPLREREMKIAQLADICLDKGYYHTASKFITEQTHVDCLRNLFFQRYAEKRLVNPALTQEVLEIGKSIRNGEKGIMQDVVAALAKNNHIDQACALAQKQNTIDCSKLLEIVAAALQLKGNIARAKEVTALIPDEGIRGDASFFLYPW